MSKQANRTDEMSAIVAQCIETAKRAGARESSVRGYRVREVSLDYRDGKVEKISEATRRGVSIELFVNERYSMVSTSDLRPEALTTFIGDSIALAKTLASDPYRALPDPALYKGQATIDLKLEDPRYENVSAAEAEKRGKVLHDAARGAPGNQSILSVTAFSASTLVENWQMSSNGFSGTSRGTSIFNWRAGQRQGRRRASPGRV